MTYPDIQHFIQEANFLLDKVVDGDSLSVIGICTGEKREIRLYGIDVPETRKGRKLRIDEEKSRMAGRLLQQLGIQAREFVNNLCPIGTPLTLYTEPGNELDYYGRHLAYVILPDGNCLNNILLREGYAKATTNYFCNELHSYQLENWQAKRRKRGLYKIVKQF